MGYRIAADLLVVLHVLFVVFVVLGGLLALRWRRIIWVHLPAAAWGRRSAARSFAAPCLAALCLAT